MSKVIDLTGQKFNKLTVIKWAGKQGKQSLWECRCECGKTKTVRGDSLKNESIRSCGCLQKEAVATHGMSYTKEYGIWGSMLCRCRNPNHRQYADYGGRGIKVCERWESFESFLTDMGERPLDVVSIDRIDNEGNYEPSNCRWAMKKEQDNNRRSNKLVEYKGQTKTVAEWCDELELSRQTIYQRLNRGWSPERAFTE